jgi:hypothetical protein
MKQKRHDDAGTDSGNCLINRHNKVIYGVKGSVDDAGRGTPYFTLNGDCNPSGYGGGHGVGAVIHEAAGHGGVPLGRGPAARHREAQGRG